MKETIYTVKKECDLMTFLLNHYSRKQIKIFLKYKQVYINNVANSQFDTMLNIGDKISIKKAVENNLDIIYEDDEVVVINKPSGLLSIADSGEKQKTAYHLVGEYLKKSNFNAKVYVVHRLDRETSGVLLFAKSEKVKLMLQENWNKIVYKRGYIAITEGVLKQKEGVIKNYLDESKTQKVYITKNSNGKLAITNYKVIKENRHNSLVEIFLDTGRKNQIRVHMESLGCSIVGDKKYGATSNPIKRLGLHANIVAFTHPKTNKKMEFIAPLPNEFVKNFK